MEQILSKDLAIQEHFEIVFQIADIENKIIDMHSSNEFDWMVYEGLLEAGNAIAAVIEPSYVGADDSKLRRA
jgi:hypothetical protein